MNRLFVMGLCLGLKFSGDALLAQETKTNSVPKIPATEAKEHVGQQMTVSGKVAEVNKRERLVRLNLDKAYPKEAFTAVIFSANTNNFGDLEKLRGKHVEVVGKITDYRGHPQIILTSTNQLKLIENSAENK